MKKKLLLMVVMLAFTALVLGIRPAPVFAAAEVPLVAEKTEALRTIGPTVDRLSEYTDAAAFRSYLLAQFKTGATSVDISQFRFPYSQEMANLIGFYLDKEMPEAFHVVSGTALFYGSPYFTRVEFTFNMNASQYNTALTACDARAEHLTRGLNGLTDAEKALVLHDRLATYCRYDHDVSAEGIYEMTGALLNKLAVCEGYAQAYAYLLDRVGIPNYFCISEDMRHGWNILYIDGVKYHTDVTWGDCYGLDDYLSHTEFLRSTEGMISTGHHQNGVVDYDTSPTDTRYDSAWWSDLTCPIEAARGDLYYVDRAGKALMKVDGNTHTKVLTIDDDWYVDAFSYWPSAYTALASDGKDLLYTTSDSLYRYYPETGKSELLYTLSIAQGQNIFGLSYENGKAVCRIAKQPQISDANTNDYLVELSCPVHTHSYSSDSDSSCNGCGAIRSTGVLLGDVDGSGTVDSNDAIHLLFHVMFPARYEVNQPADFDASGTADAEDAIYLLFYVMFPERYPL